MIRLFVAIPLPDEVRTYLSMVRAGAEGVNWVPPENLHLTLRFIGEVDRTTATEIAVALEDVRANSFDVTVRGFGVFGEGRRIHTLWAGVGLSEPMKLLKNRVDANLRDLDLDLDTRRFTPHITLARLKRPDPERLKNLVESRNLDLSTTFPVNSFSLFSSVLTRERPFYREEAVYSLDP